MHVTQLLLFNVNLHVLETEDAMKEDGWGRG